MWGYQKLESTTPSLCQAGLSGQGGQLSDALDILRANHKKVMTVPFLPICQASRGKKRITILQETEKDVISSLANDSYSKTHRLGTPTMGSQTSLP